MKQIPLTQGKFALVDNEDYCFLMQWKWYYGSGYARRTERSRTATGVIIRKTIRMHRIIKNSPDGLQIDHIDMNPLNNQKQNLRMCSQGKNNLNVKKRTGKKGISSKYKGVHWCKRTERYISRISKDGTIIYLGSFDADEEMKAALAYNQAAIKYHKKFARLNQM